MVDQTVKPIGDILTSRKSTMGPHYPPEPLRRALTVGAGEIVKPEHWLLASPGEKVLVAFLSSSVKMIARIERVAGRNIEKATVIRFHPDDRSDYAGLGTDDAVSFLEQNIEGPAPIYG